ncbi:MAG: hypothetical protein ACKPCP_05650 [Sphaerospermopsis kisseleviana]
MLTQIPQIQADIEDGIEDSNDNLQGETTRYLNHIETKLYADIQARKRVDSGLLFIACQFSSCSLSWLLFDLQVTLSVIQLASFCVSCLPGLVELGDSFNFSLSSESWEFSLGQKPLVGIVKLAIGFTVSWNSTTRITQEITNTYSEIAQTYQEIRSREGLSFQLPNIGTSVLVVVAALLLIGIFKKFQIPGDNNDL